MQLFFLLVMVPVKRAFSKVSNAERVVKIFSLGAELRLSVYHNASTVKISKLIVVSLKRFVADRTMTLRTLCAYDQYLRTLFMELHPGHIIPEYTQY